MSRYIIMSDEIPEVNQNIYNLGYEIIKSDYIECLLPYEKRHADIQCLRINDTFFVLKEAVKLREKLLSLGLNIITTVENIRAEYPKNVLLNAVYMRKKLYCRADTVDNTVKEYCNKHKIELINIKQGYTKCSTAVYENCFITADKGIFEAMSQNREEGLLIDSGDIDLEGVDYGFIGGTSFYDNGTAYFTGDITQHKSYSIIKEYLNKKGINICSLSDKRIYDIGGFIVI